MTTHWHQRLNRRMEELGIGKAQLARDAGVTKGMVTQWTQGTIAQPKKDSLRKVCRVLQCSEDWLLYGAGQIREDDEQYVTGQVRRVPVVGTAQLGDNGYWLDLGYPEGHGDGYLEAPVRDKYAYAVRVRGDSMSPAIRDGWFVIAAPHNEPTPGEFVLVKTTDGRSMVKELLWQAGDRISLMSVADGHDRLTLQRDEVEFIHPILYVAPPSASKEL